MKDQNFLVFETIIFCEPKQTIPKNIQFPGIGSFVFFKLELDFEGEPFHVAFSTCKPTYT